MKKILKNAMVIMFALALTFTTVTTASAHSPTDPANSETFTVWQRNTNNGWYRSYVFQFNLYLPNDGPLFLADAVNNWNWTMERSGRMDVGASFEHYADYRVLVTSPNGQIFYDETFYNTNSFFTSTNNLNAGVYRALIFKTNGQYPEFFLLSNYSVSASYN